MTSLFPYLILAVLFVRGITLEGSVQGIIYYLKPEFHRLLSAQVSHHLLSQARVPQTPLCSGQSSSTTSNQSSTDSSLHRSVIIYYLKPEFHRLPSVQVSHHLLSQTRFPLTPLCTCQSSSTISNQSSTDSPLHRSVILYYHTPEFHRPLSAQVSYHLLRSVIIIYMKQRLISTQIGHHLLKHEFHRFCSARVNWWDPKEHVIASDIRHHT